MCIKQKRDFRSGYGQMKWIRIWYTDKHSTPILLLTILFSAVDERRSGVQAEGRSPGAQVRPEQGRVHAIPQGRSS